MATNSCDPTEKVRADSLLKMIEEENRRLEQDSRYTQKITRTDSNASSVDIQQQSLTPPAAAIPASSSTNNSEQQQQQPQQQEVGVATTTVTSPVDDSSTEEELLCLWSGLLKNWEENVKKNSKVIKQCVRRGIPDPLRGMAWQLLSGPHNEELKKMYPALIIESCPFEKQIKRDLDRTFPEHSFFKDRDGIGQESLLSVMKAYSLYDREVGYCQGSLFLAGQLLMHMPEEETFCVFVQLMNKYKLRELYKPSMTKLSLCFYQLENLVEEFFPKLHIHFKALGFYTSMYSSSWFLTLFASTLPLNISFRVMDIFLEEGIETVFRLGLALMEHSHNQLMQMDLEEMTKLLQKEVKTIHEKNPDPLFERAFKIKLTSKKLKKLEKEFMLKKEKQATENSSIIQLRDENEDLEKRVMALEMECAALADRLIQGQVTRAQEAEEMFAVRRDAARLRKKVKAMEENEVRLSGGKWSPNSNQSLHVICEREKSTSAPSLRDEPVSSPSTPNTLNTQHVSREEAQECLRELGVSPSTTPTQKPPTPDPVPVVPDMESILRELATAKIHHVETLHGLELKGLELRNTQQRERELRKELEQARELISSLTKEREETDSSLACPHCGKTYTPSKISLDDSSKTGEEEEEDRDVSNQSSITSQNGGGEDPKYSSLISSLKNVQTLMDSSSIPTTTTSTTSSDSVSKCDANGIVEDS